jgi:excisionase family DNA binding protein
VITTDPVPRLALNPEEASAATGIGGNEIYRLIRAGRLGAVRVGSKGGKLVLPIPELMDFLVRELVREEVRTTESKRQPKAEVPHA